MRIWLAGTALVFAIGCGNDSAFTGAETPTPTPTPSGSPTPTPTPGSGPGGLYELYPNPNTTQYCGSGVGATFNVSYVTVNVSGTDFTPDWGHSSNPNIALVEPPHGTLTGNDFSSSWAFCAYDGFVNKTTKNSYTWTGTFSNGGDNFNSTLIVKMVNADGDQRPNCATVATDMGTCSEPGLGWALAGVRQ